jgi:ABC-type transport system involved in cytochrome bd biosynthesis fused ATPase/permease subunit
MVDLIRWHGVHEWHANSVLRVTQKFVSLSMTKAKIAAGVMEAQDMLYMYRLLEVLQLTVELPMLIEIDNSGDAVIVNSWRSGVVLITLMFVIIFMLAEGSRDADHEAHSWGH